MSNKVSSIASSPLLISGWIARLTNLLYLSDILVIGDQFFTDILGGKIMLTKTFLVEPISKESEGVTVKIRRKLTAPFTNKIMNRDNPYRKK